MKRKKNLLRKSLFLNITIGISLGVIIPLFSLFFTSFKYNYFIVIYILLSVIAGTIITVISFFIEKRFFYKTITTINERAKTKSIEKDGVDTIELEFDNEIDYFVNYIYDKTDILRETNKELIRWKNKAEDRENELKSHQMELMMKKGVIEQELKMARKIQMRLIPSVSPLPNIAFYYKPMEEVGGDFFDFIKCFNPNWTGIFLSDVSGHGIPAAFITSMIKSSLLQFGEVITEPSQLLSMLNKLLMDQIEGFFVTAFYGIYDTITGEFTYANAGHPPPYLLENGDISFLTNDKTCLPLAVLDNEEIEKRNKKFITNRVTLNKGSKLLLFTDGLLEAINIEDKEKFGHKGIKDFEESCIMTALNELMTSKPQEVIDGLVERLIDFRGSDNFDDDVCMICLDV